MSDDVELPGNIRGKVANTPKVLNPPDRLVGSMEAVVDPTPQKLTPRLRGFEGSCLRIPGDLSREAQDTLKSLFSCFERQGEVKEGLIGDLIWGFSQIGIAPEKTIHGLKELEKNGYLRFKAPDGVYVDFTSDKIGKAWVKYSKPLLDMVYEGKEAEVKDFAGSSSKRHDSVGKSDSDQQSPK